MQEQVIFQARVDKQLRDDAVAILEELGLELPTAFRMFLRSIVREKGLPLNMNISKNQIELNGTSSPISKETAIKTLLRFDPPHVGPKEVFLYPGESISGTIPTNMFVQLICKIPEGKITRWDEIESFLKKAYHTNVISRGFGVWPWYTHDEQPIPYWRVVSTRGILSDHPTCSRDHQQEKLVKEGFCIIKSGPNGRSLKVSHYRDFIYDFSDLTIIQGEQATNNRT